MSGVGGIVRLRWTKCKLHRFLVAVLLGMTNVERSDLKLCCAEIDVPPFPHFPSIHRPASRHLKADKKV